jgi:hypothetical protein
VPNYTEVAQKGAYSAEAVYTPRDVAHIVSYAAEVRYSFRLPENKQHSHIYGINTQRGIDVLVVRGFLGKGG